MTRQDTIKLLQHIVDTNGNIQAGYMEKNFSFELFLQLCQKNIDLEKTKTLLLTLKNQELLSK